MRRVATLEIESQAVGERVFASSGLWTLSVSRTGLEILAWLSLAYLLASHFAHRNYWLLGPGLALLSVLLLEFSYLFVVSGVVFAAVYRYRYLFGSFYARLLVLGTSVGLWYSLSIALGWLEGFGSLNFLVLVTLLGGVLVIYAQALRGLEKSSSI